MGVISEVGQVRESSKAPPTLAACSLAQNTYIWMFPKMGVPPNHPFIDGIFPYKPSSYWVPYGQLDFSHPSADLWGPIPRHSRDGPGGSYTTPPIWECLYYHSTVMTGGLCKWQCEIPTAKNCGKVTGMEF